MSANFQADMKELDEKFAAIPDDVKKRYDRHRFIRRAVMTYWTSTVATFYLWGLFGSFLEPHFMDSDAQSTPEIFRYIRDIMMMFYLFARRFIP